MKTKDVVKYLREVREVTKESVAYDPEHTEALTEAIKRIETPSDRFLANEILILAGLVLGAVGIISVLCGVIYILLGNYTAAWAMLPWAITAAIAALLAFAGVRK